MTKRSSIISRKSLLLKLHPANHAKTRNLQQTPQRKSPLTALQSFKGEDLTVLVVNSSHDMAKEITMQLTLNIPGCSIMYAPSIELAKWILRRKDIGLVISNPVLPDGGVGRLNEVLPELQKRPDVVVVGGGMAVRNAQVFGKSGYSFAAYRQIGKHSTADDEQATQESGLPRLPKTSPIQRRIKDLGADIRNDLNNPLQEIVAMVFVAQAAQQVSPGTSEALKAIDLAAKNMAQYVRGLESKIEEAVIANQPVIVQ